MVAGVQDTGLVDRAGPFGSRSRMGSFSSWHHRRMDHVCPSVAIHHAPRAGHRAGPPSLGWERHFWDAGFGVVTGVDEVGRGALAGPLLAAAVVLPSCSGAALRTMRSSLRGVYDSKQLTSAERNRLAARIEVIASAVSIGAVPSWELDLIGLAAANRLAMERAVHGLGTAPQVILLDACTIDHPAPQIGLIRGDTWSLSIAAASIVAKVTRDQLMDDLDALDCAYAFGTHKGYGTRHHLAVLARYGPSPYHRQTFAPVKPRP